MGVGEAAALPPLVPPLCNAVVAATGPRVRMLSPAREGHVLST